MDCGLERPRKTRCDRSEQQAATADHPCFVSLYGVFLFSSNITSGLQSHPLFILDHPIS